MTKRNRRGWCTALHLQEENARFLLLAVVLIIYLLFGATIFHYLEKDGEDIAREKYWKTFNDFVNKYKRVVNISDIELLLYEYGNATTSGLVGKRQRWDFFGSFYFVSTVVTTIGFGMSTPKSIIGRLVLIIYGFFGCSCGILFFNLFLERIITLLAYVMRFYHERKLRILERSNSPGRRRDSMGSFDDKYDDNWKPSVYWVMICLICATILVSVLSSLIYSKMEKWTYLESIYFCFVAFSTIGFGDFVANQKPYYENKELYQLANFILISLGCCCIYSLFNVTSIVIKQFLNYLIKKLDFDCRCFAKKKSPIVTQISRSRRNALTPHHLKNYVSEPRKVNVKACLSEAQSDPDSNYDSDYERRNSNEMISMKDLLKTNKVSLALLQKQLYETAQHNREHRNLNILLPSRMNKESDDFQTGTVGPLAIVSKKLGEDEI